MENVNLREIIRKKIKEMSVTGGTASFTPGEGANYATPNAFNPNKKAKGAQNIYYYKLGFKPVDTKALHKKAKGIDHKTLWIPKLPRISSIIWDGYSRIILRRFNNFI